MRWIVKAMMRFVDDKKPLSNNRGSRIREIRGPIDVDLAVCIEFFSNLSFMVMPSAYSLSGCMAGLALAGQYSSIQGL